MLKKTILLLASVAVLEIASLAVFSLSMKVWQVQYAAGKFGQNDLPSRTLTVNYLDKKMELTAGGNLRSLGQFLTALAAEIDRPYQDAALTIQTDRATDFRPSLDGQVLDLALAQKLIIDALVSEESEAALPVVLTKPQIALGNLNNLGIRELIASGKSDFTGSSAARITNIRAGSSQYNGVIIQQGEEFSFNKYLGPVDAEHGFLPELVIKTINGQPGSVPEFGGGLCQVSTTAFRAAFFAGLPITARRNHSFAVRYYEWIDDDLPRAVGLDATIYSGVQDMKFINDTPGAILIWTRMEGKRLYFDFYGTKDDREVLVDGPHPYDRRASRGA